MAADAIQKAGTAMPKNEINWILVYDANTLGYPLPAGNKNAVCSTKCVKYVWDAGAEQVPVRRGAPGSPPRSTPASTTRLVSRWE